MDELCLYSTQKGRIVELLQTYSMPMLVLGVIPLCPRRATSLEPSITHVSRSVLQSYLCASLLSTIEIIMFTPCANYTTQFSSAAFTFLKLSGPAESLEPSLQLKPRRNLGVKPMVYFLVPRSYYHQFPNGFIDHQHTVKQLQFGYPCYLVLFEDVSSKFVLNPQNLNLLNQQLILHIKRFIKHS